MEWAAKKRPRGKKTIGSKERVEDRVGYLNGDGDGVQGDGEGDGVQGEGDGVQGEGGTWAQEILIRKPENKFTIENQGDSLADYNDDGDTVTMDVDSPAFEEYDVEFSVIRGCSSTEWMKGLGREAKTITARIIKPPKEASEQRPTLCTYEGVLTTMTSIRGYVFSTPVTVEGEKQLVGEFEMKKIE